MIEEERQLRSSIAAKTGSKSAAAIPIKWEIAVQLRSTLESALRQKFQQRGLERSENLDEETFSLPAQAGGDQLSVRALEVQKAPLYQRKRALVRVRCECCGMERYDSFNALIFISGYRTRQIEYLSDNTQRVFEF